MPESKIQAEHGDRKIEADFLENVEYPLVKTKFGVYNSGIVPVEHYQRDADRFAEVHPECLRIDLAWGADWSGWTKQPVYGSATDIRYDYNEMDAIAEILNQRKVLPYWSYCYTPLPLENPPGDWKSVPCDMSKWGEILANFVKHHRENSPSVHVGYHEIGNEPDGINFFLGGLEEYLAMYRQAASRMRNADPDAMIGGFAVESKDEWIPTFLEYVQQNDLPLDFFSFHFYGTNSPKRSTRQDLTEWLKDIRDYFANKPEFYTTEFHLNEFNTFPIDYPIDGPQQKYPLAAALLKDYKFLLSQSSVSLVLWAQFLDSGQGNFSGMVSIDGHRKAVFNAYKIYTMMPVDRRKVKISGPQGLDGMASTDKHKSSLVLWNLTGKKQDIDIIFRNIPFKQGSFRLYRIDGNHASWGDNPDNENLVPVESHSNIDTVDYQWKGNIPVDGVVYFEIDDGSALSELTPVPVADVKRVLHYYPDRNSSAYADFDKNTWCAWLGTVHEVQADLKVGVTAENLPESLDVSFEVTGTLQKFNVNSILGFRIDYMENEAYSKSVLFHGPYKGGLDLFDPAGCQIMPWGTERHADQVIQVKDLSSFQVDITAFSPMNWNGRVQLTVLMEDTGVHTQAKVIIRKF